QQSKELFRTASNVFFKRFTSGHYDLRVLQRHSDVAADRLSWQWPVAKTQVPKQRPRTVAVNHGLIACLRKSDEAYRSLSYIVDTVSIVGGQVHGSASSYTAHRAELWRQQPEHGCVLTPFTSRCGFAF